MIPELRKALYEAGKTVNGLSGNFFHLEAPRKLKKYAVYSQVTNPFSRDSASKFEDVYININYYAESADDVEALSEAGKLVFDDSEALLNTQLNDYYLDRIERQFTRDQKNDDVFMISHQYKLELTSGKGNFEMKPYKIYTALLSQSGTAAPVAIILENTIGDIVWTRTGVGQYKGTLSGAFTLNKTFIVVKSVYTSGIHDGKVFFETSESANEIWLNHWSIAQQPFDSFPNTEIEIRVYI